MKEFLAALVGSIAGGVFALAGSYLASRWQAAHQRANLLHEARISLYVDIVSECQRMTTELDLLRDSYAAWLKIREHNDRYRPAVPIEARLELLALPRVHRAWDALSAAQQRVGEALGEDWPTHEGDFISAGMPEVMEVRRLLVEVVEAARADLGVRGQG